MAKIISVCSEKGGAGKTTATLNIARGLAKKGKKVLVIDLDQQGNASRALGYIKDGKYTISDCPQVWKRIMQTLFVTARVALTMYRLPRC